MGTRSLLCSRLYGHVLILRVNKQLRMKYMATILLTKIKTTLRSTTSLPLVGSFINKRRYLFSKYDQGIKLDEESWYSVTPESMGEYLAERVNEVFPDQEVNVLDAFAGCGGNIIQFARACTKVYGCEIDQTKINYCHHNCSIYGVTNYKVCLKDYLKSTAKDFDNNKINAVFLSPPWGGVGYTQMDKYKFEYMHPNFNDTLTKSLEFSGNLILFIPRNTDVKEICSVLSIYAEKMNSMGRKNEIAIEIERLGHQAGATSVLVVYTGELARVNNEEICQHLCDHYLNLPTEQESAIECVSNLLALLDMKGPSYFTNDVFLRKGQAAISAETVVDKKIKQLSKDEKEIFTQIKAGYMYSDGYEDHNEEAKIMDSDPHPSKAKKWWVKSSEG